MEAIRLSNRKCFLTHTGSTSYTCCCTLVVFVAIALPQYILVAVKLFLLVAKVLCTVLYFGSGGNSVPKKVLPEWQDLALITGACLHFCSICNDYRGVQAPIISDKSSNSKSAFFGTPCCVAVLCISLLWWQ